MRDDISIFTEDMDGEITCVAPEAYNLIFEGDNLYSLRLLEKIRTEWIDVIHIDPPYNRSKGNLWFQFFTNYYDYHIFECGV